MKKILYKTDQNNPVIQAYKEAVEKGKKDKHILPQGDKWIVKNLLVEKPSQIFGTQQEATNYARSTASSGTTIFVHGQNGRIEDRQDL